MTAGSAGLSASAVVDHDVMQEGWSGRPAMMPSLGGNLAMWNMQALGGIGPDPDGPGFKRSIIKPNIVDGLHWVECSYDSVYGRIVCNWRKRGNRLAMDVTIPANTTATVYLPAQDVSMVTESGDSVRSAPGLKLLRIQDGRVVLSVESGIYRFLAILPVGQPDKH